MLRNSGMIFRKRIINKFPKVCNYKTRKKSIRICGQIRFFGQKTPPVPASVRKNVSCDSHPLLLLHLK